MESEKNIVISIHGIKTEGKWQEKLGNLLEEQNITHRPYKFGNYDLLQFLNPKSNKKLIENFYLFYCSIVKKTNKIPSVVAHSLGTFIIAECLLKRQDIKFDKIIFCGSLLSENFDWNTLLARNQVNQVRNEYSKLDFWSRIVEKFVKKTGRSGYSGYNYKRPGFFEKRYDYGHSDYFKGNHMSEFWIPFLKENNPIFNVIYGAEIPLEQYYKYLDECREIDVECFSSVTDFRLPEGLTKKWISINNDIYTFVKENISNEIKGYINAIPLQNETFQKLLTGKISDDEIIEDDIVPFLKNKELKIYFMSIATQLDVRQFRGGLINTVADRLFAGFLKKLIDYWDNDNIKVVECATIAWTAQGRSICREIGMQEVGRDKYGHPIYFIKTENLKNSKNYFIQGIDNLCKLY